MKITLHICLSKRWVIFGVNMMQNRAMIHYSLYSQLQTLTFNPCVQVQICNSALNMKKRTIV